MLEVDCLDTHGNPIDYYTQWDINQTMKIVIHGYNDGKMTIAPEVHFANSKSTEALVVRSQLEVTNTVVVDVPNVLLQEGHPIYVYVYIADEDDAHSQKTIVKIEIPVRQRACPSDYDYVENIERITAEIIKEEVEEKISAEINSGNLMLEGITLKDVVTAKPFKLYVSNGKLILEDVNAQEGA